MWFSQVDGWGQAFLPTLVSVGMVFVILSGGLCPDMCNLLACVLSSVEYWSGTLCWCVILSVCTSLPSTSWPCTLCLPYSYSHKLVSFAAFLPRSPQFILDDSRPSTWRTFSPEVVIIFNQSSRSPLMMNVKYLQADWGQKCGLMSSLRVFIWAGCSTLFPYLSTTY